MTTMHILTADTAPTGWLGVDWGSIALVFVIALVVTVVIASAFAFGTRLLAIGAPDIVLSTPDADPDGPDALALPRATPRPLAATVAAWVCFAIGIAATAYGIYLVIPLFHA